MAQRGKVDAALGLYRGEVDDLDFPRWPYAADRVVALGLTRLPQPTLQTLANYRLIWVRGYSFQDQLPGISRYQEVQRRDGIPAMLREGHADFYIDDDAEVVLQDGLELDGLTEQQAGVQGEGGQAQPAAAPAESAPAPASSASVPLACRRRTSIWNRRSCACTKPRARYRSS